MVAAAGHGRILIWEGASLWLMKALPAPGDAVNTTDFHSHHALQATLSLGGRFKLGTQAQSISTDAAVAPDTSHIFEAAGPVAILLIEPESRSGRAIARNLFDKSPLAPIPQELVFDLVAQLKVSWCDQDRNDAVLVALGRSIVARLAGLGEAELPDPRVQKIVAHVASRLDHPITLESVAESVGLSSSRVRHLFVEHTGLPFRTYLLWLRLMKAVGVFAGGGSLTEAAYEAGFADSAHFSRTFRRMFGIPAAALRLT